MADFLIPKPIEIAINNYKGTHIARSKNAAYSAQEIYALAKEDFTSWWAIGMAFYLNNVLQVIVVSNNDKQACVQSNKSANPGDTIEFLYGDQTYYYSAIALEIADDYIDTSDTIIPAYSAIELSITSYENAALELISLYSENGGILPGEVNFPTSWIRKLVNGIWKNSFTFAHVKTVYIDYKNKKTLADKLSEIDIEIGNKANKTEIPTKLPANGGNADTVEEHTVKSDVPENAIFTDTVYDDSDIKKAIENKVDKVSGKGLSTNDYSTADKEKLAGIDDGANKIVVDDALSSASENPVQNKIIKSELDKKAPLDSPKFTGSISLGRTGDIGESSVAMGNLVEASGIAAVAFSNGKAKGDHSFAEGDGTASGSYSHAEGANSTASGNGSHAEGISEASGLYSHAEGITTAHGDYQHTEGRYNLDDEEGTYAHIVGNGTSKYQKSNAYTLDWDGNGEYAGTMKSKKVDTKEMDFTPANSNDYQKKMVPVNGSNEIISNPLIIDPTKKSEMGVIKGYRYTYAKSSTAQFDILDAIVSSLTQVSGITVTPKTSRPEKSYTIKGTATEDVTIPLYSVSSPSNKTIYICVEEISGMSETSYYFSAKDESTHTVNLTAGGFKSMTKHTGKVTVSLVVKSGATIKNNTIAVARAGYTSHAVFSDYSPQKYSDTIDNVIDAVLDLNERLKLIEEKLQ